MFCKGGLSIAIVGRRVFPKKADAACIKKILPLKLCHCAVRLLVGHGIVNCGLQRLPRIELLIFKSTKVLLGPCFKRGCLVSQFCWRRLAHSSFPCVCAYVSSHRFPMFVCVHATVNEHLSWRYFKDMEIGQCRLVKAFAQSEPACSLYQTACHAKFRTFQRLFAFVEQELYQMHWNTLETIAFMYKHVYYNVRIKLIHLQKT